VILDHEVAEYPSDLIHLSSEGGSVMSVSVSLSVLKKV
jgi:hypothetical protein